MTGHPEISPPPGRLLSHRVVCLLYTAVCNFFFICKFWILKNFSILDRRVNGLEVGFQNYDRFRMWGELVYGMSYGFLPDYKLWIVFGFQWFIVVSITILIKFVLASFWFPVSESTKHVRLFVLSLFLLLCLFRAVFKRVAVVFRR